MIFTPSLLHSLLYGFDDFARLALKSVHPKDSPILRVKLVPFDLGVTIRAEDPKEEVFHVELYAMTSPPRAELWSAKAWQESLTKRWQNRQPEQYEAPTPLQSKVIQFQSELTRVLVGRALPITSARDIAECLLRGEQEQVESLITLLALHPTYTFKLADLRREMQIEEQIPIEDEDELIQKHCDERAHYRAEIP